MFPREFCKTFKSTCLIEHLRWLLLVMVHNESRQYMKPLFLSLNKSLTHWVLQFIEIDDLIVICKNNNNYNNNNNNFFCKQCFSREKFTEILCFFFIWNSIKKRNSVCLSVLKSKIKEWYSHNSKCRLCMKYLRVAFF